MPSSGDPFKDLGDPPSLERVVTNQTLWHYSDTTAVLGIVQKKVLFASSASMLNDSQELAYGLKVAQEAISELSHRDVEQQALQEAREQLVNRNAVFVACASSRADDLAQWRGYAKSGGYAVGLKAKPLRVVVENSAAVAEARGSILDPGWRKVVYEPKRQRELVEQWCDFNKRAVDQGIDSDLLVQRARTILINLVVGFKHPGFASENEARACFEDTAAQAFPVEFRSTTQGITPYVQLGYRRERGRYVEVVDNARCAPLPIKTIMVGPGRDMEVAKAGLEKLKSVTEGADWVIKLSGVPYRS